MLLLLPFTKKHAVLLLSLVFLLPFFSAVTAGETTTEQQQQQQQQQCSANDSSECTINIKEYNSFYINGTWVEASNEENGILNVINPSTGKPFASISLATPGDVDRAVDSARQTFDSTEWSSISSLPTRRKCLKRLLKIYKTRREEMAQIISQEMGAPISLSRSSQAPAGSNAIETYLDVLDDGFEFERILGDEEYGYSTLLYQPVGVVALITPWNWPMNQVALKVGAALAVGCTVILKPSEIAPLSSRLFTEMVHEAGFPPGVFNMINGEGPHPGAGALLSSHPDIDMISFTGSTAGGIDVSKNAAGTLKRVSLELGGKGANIVFADVQNLNRVVRRGVDHLLTNSGQSCNAPSRMLVERSVYENAIKYAKKEAEACHVKPANTEGDDYIGPVVSQNQYNRIQNYIQSGIDDPGARLITGGLGNAIDGSNGYFVKPTIFADVNPKSKIAQEEIFGPVLVMIPFDSEQEAIQISNDVLYGLTNYAHTSSKSRLKRLAQKLKSGMVQMNGIGGSYLAPFGGIKMSGNGRENGPFGLEEFCIVKSVSGWPYDDDVEEDAEDDYGDYGYEKQ